MHKNIIVIVIQNFLRGEEYACCDDYIKALNTDEMKDSLLVDVVRATVHYRNDLRNWPDLLERVSAELYRRGLIEAPSATQLWQGIPGVDLHL